MFNILQNNLIKEEYKNEFEKETLTTNISREKILADAVIFINILLMINDIRISQITWTKTPAFKNLFYLHLSITFIMGLFRLIEHFVSKSAENSKTRYYKLLNTLFIVLMSLWCEIVSINDQFIHKQITVYLIGTICIAAILIINSIYIIGFFSISSVIFIAGLADTGQKYNIMFGNIVNSLVVLILAIVILRINYNAHAKNFLYKKVIIQKNLHLEEYEKLRTDFFVNICHEIKTPLNIIFCGEQMLSMITQNGFSENNKDKFEKYSSMIKQNCYRLIRLISNMVDITKADANCINMNLENYDIINIVKNIIESIKLYTENKGKKLYYNSTVDSLIMACDADMIERIILNLLSNAIKFTPNDGEIYVNINRNDNNILISVKDSGQGIEKEKTELIFNRFVRIDKSLSRNSEGSGIGLALVKSFVEMHKGTIRVFSELGKGSEFIVELPISTVGKERKDYINNNENIEKINIEFSDIYF